MRECVLKTSDGVRKENPSEEEIRSALGKIGGGIEYCILEPADGGFIQAAGLKNRLRIRYRDDSGYYESADDNFSAESAGDILAEARAGGRVWKAAYSFTPLETDGAARGPSLKDQLRNAVRTEAVGDVKRLVRNGLRRFLGLRL